MDLKEFKERYKKDCMNFVKSWNFVRCDRGIVEIYTAKNQNCLLHVMNDCLCSDYQTFQDAYKHLGEYQCFFEVFNSCDLISFLNDYNETHDNVNIEITLIDY